MATTMRLIAKVEVGSGGAANIDFTSIPGTYTDLLVVLSQRNDNASGNAQNTRLNMNINGVGTNRSWRRLESYSGTTVGSDSGTDALAGMSPGALATSSTFSNVEIYIPNYAGSTNKSFSVTSVVENNSATNNSVQLLAALWSSTAAITQLTFSPGSGNFVQYSSAFLYGITKS